MKSLRYALVSAALVLGMASSAHARDVGFSISIGSPGYYYGPPPVVYHAPPIVHYRPAPIVHYYYAPPRHVYHHQPRFRNDFRHGKHYHQHGRNRGWR